MKATDLDFLGPARRARADASREARLAPAAEETRAADFASLIGAGPAARKPRADPRESPEPPRDAPKATEGAPKEAAPDAPARAPASDVAAETGETAAGDPAQSAATPDPAAEAAVVATPEAAPAPAAPSGGTAEEGQPPSAASAGTASAPAAEPPPPAAAPALPTARASSQANPADDASSGAKPARAAAAERNATEPALAAEAKPSPPREAAPAAAEKADAPATAPATSATAVADPSSSPAAGLGAPSVQPASLAPDPGWRLVPAPAAHVAARADPRAVLNQISVAVAEGKQGVIEIRLDPAELGRVHIALSETGKGLRATLSAERPETVELLRRNSDALMRELSAAGFGAVSVDLAQGGERRDTGAEPRRAALYTGAPGLAEPQGPATVAAAIAVSRAPDGPLDIRL